MTPRFDRRRDQGQGSGAGQGRPFRGPRPFKARGEWRPDGPQREGRPERGERSERSDRPERGERRFDRPRFDDRRPEGGRPTGPRLDGPRAGGGGRFDGPRPGGGGRFDRARPSGAGPRADGRRFEDRRPDGRRLESRRSDGRRPFSSSQAEGRPPFRAGRPLGRPQLGGEGRPTSRRPDFNRDRGGRPPVAVEVPIGEAERFQAGPADDLIWGRHAAQAALESERPIHRIWCTPELRFQPRFLQLLREAKAGGVLVEEVTWARLGQLTDGAVHQGIVLQAAAADTLDLGALIDGCRTLGEPPLLMALDGITDPHNLGAIVRSAEALGAHGLVLPQRRSAGLTGSVAKVAAGALEHLPVARVVNLNRSLETLKDEGYRVIGLAGEGSVSLSEADLEGPLVIVTGSEGSGLSMLTRKHCDQLVRIPLRGATPSLNASVATAMVLYEVARRGWMKQITGSAPAPRIMRPALPAPARVVSAPSADAPPPDASSASSQPMTVSTSAAEGNAAEPNAADPNVALDAAPASPAPLPAVSEDETEQISAPDLRLDLTPSAPSGFSGDIRL